MSSMSRHTSAGAFAAHGDVLAVGAADLAGTNILASYNAATETLTLSWTDTLAHYGQVLAHVTFQTSNFDNDRAQTIDWQLNDGAAAVVVTSANSIATSVIGRWRPVRTFASLIGVGSGSRTVRRRRLWMRSAVPGAGADA